MSNIITEYLIEYRNIKVNHYARDSYGGKDKELALKIAAKAALHPDIKARVVKQTREVLKVF